ncbi:MAG: protoporphyrin/coproporphyrin ferrochelatase [Chloroflexota bacterium]|jgi:ferrochelatase|nr:protoporphyrin/coproporphyrin ferrochelatase [Chloroflexota bacterium]
MTTPVDRSDGPVGVVLMTYGSAQTSDEVPAYLASVRGGRAADPELVIEFQRRYELIGYSPLVRITQAQGQALQEHLDATHGRGTHRVEVGMLHSEPRIEAAVRRLAAARVSRLVGVVLSPQWSPIIMGGYTRAFDAAAGSHLPGVPHRVAGPWHDLPAFIESLAGRVREALDSLPPPDRDNLAILLTAHSLPESVVRREPDYLEQVMATVRAVAASAGLEPGQWEFAYQSAGHSPEPWLTPDLKDLLPGYREAGRTGVLVVPVQFLADHLEILYDIDVAAREEAESEGLAFHRIELMNTSPRFIAALAEVVARETESVATPA